MRKLRVELIVKTHERNRRKTGEGWQEKKQSIIMCLNLEENREERATGKAVVDLYVRWVKNELCEEN